jgi:hypothetical protein
MAYSTEDAKLYKWVFFTIQQVWFPQARLDWESYGWIVPSLMVDDSLRLYLTAETVVQSSNWE